MQNNFVCFYLTPFSLILSVLMTNFITETGFSSFSSNVLLDVVCFLEYLTLISSYIFTFLLQSFMFLLSIYKYLLAFLLDILFSSQILKKKFVVLNSNSKYFLLVSIISFSIYIKVITVQNFSYNYYKKIKSIFSDIKCIDIK